MRRLDFISSGSRLRLPAGSTPAVSAKIHAYLPQIISPFYLYAFLAMPFVTDTVPVRLRRKPERPAVYKHEAKCPPEGQIFGHRDVFYAIQRARRAVKRALRGRRKM